MSKCVKQEQSPGIMQGATCAHKNLCSEIEMERWPKGGEKEKWRLYFLTVQLKTPELK